MMNQESSANYEDRLEFIIALMTKDYEKARDIGSRLLERNRNDVDVTRALNILRHKKHEECKRSSSIESDNERESSDATDDCGTDFINDNTVRVDSRMVGKITSRDTSRLNNEAKTSLSLKQKMHRVISIKANKKFTRK